MKPSTFIKYSPVPIYSKVSFLALELWVDVRAVINLGLQCESVKKVYVINDTILT